jgi:hypothetical protein
VEHLIANFFLTSEYNDQLSKNFRSIVKEVGEYVSGDEKLFHFTGNSGNLRLVLTKPGKVGLWFYELCGAINSSMSYLLDLKLWGVDKQFGQVEQVVKIVQRWCNCI